MIIVWSQHDKMKEDQETLHKIQKQFDDRGLIIEEQEDIIESKDDIITGLKEDNENLQIMLEKHRIKGMALQNEYDKLKNEVDRLKQFEQDAIER